jgi:hypothetical protein
MRRHLRSRTTNISLTVLATLLVLPSDVVAQSADELAKQTQNPVASLISVPLQGNWDFGLGEREAVATLLNVQPVMPFGITTDTNIILRVIMPLTSQPASDGTRINGLGDIVATAFFSPAKSGRVIWGAGPVFLLPAATSASLGSEKFGVGPSVVALTQPGNWTVGVLFNQIWSVSGANDRDDVNSTFLQPFANYNLGAGSPSGQPLKRPPTGRRTRRGRHHCSSTSARSRCSASARSAFNWLPVRRSPVQRAAPTGASGWLLRFCFHDDHPCSLRPITVQAASATPRHIASHQENSS